MNVQLSDIECRILGCLIEKEITTPEYYPLTANGVTNASNQKSNRSPTMDLTESTVQIALEVMKDKHLVWQRHVANARTIKYEHNLPGIAAFSAAETAILCELLVRGPQTPGELRGRASRMHPFPGITEVDVCLKNLATRPDGPFVMELPRQRGTKESRYCHLFSGQPALTIESPTEVAEPSPGTSRIVPAAATRSAPTAPGSVAVDEERFEALEQEVALLRNELENLKEKLAGLLG